MRIFGLGKLAKLLVAAPVGRNRCQRRRLKEKRLTQL
jgi:hypothetical protein